MRTITGMSLWVSAAHRQKCRSTRSDDQSAPGDVVTATRRSESVQRCRICIDVVSGEAASAQGISSLGDMSVNIPDLRIVWADLRPIVHPPIGSGDNSGLEQSVGLYR